MSGKPDLPLYEWVDYWSVNNNQWVQDGMVMKPEVRAELAWASHAIGHLVATLRRIALLDYSRAATNGAAFDAVRFANNALAEYSVEEVTLQ